MRYCGLFFFFLVACESKVIPQEEPIKIPVPVPEKRLKEVHASSTLSYKGQDFGPRRAFDGSSESAWCEGSKGIKGDWIEVTFTAPTTLAEISVEGGFYLNDKTLIKNGRVRKLRITTDTGWSKEAEIPYVPERMHTSKRFKVRSTPLPTPPESSSIRFEIIDADKGHTTSDVCISEIRLFLQPDGA